MMNLLDICKIGGSSVKKFDGTRKYIATGDIIDNEIASYELVNYNNKPSRANVEIKNSDVLFAKMKDTVKVLKANENNINNIYSTGFYCMTPNDNVLHEYLYYYFKSESFNSQKNKNCTGATQKAINNEGLKKIKIKFLPGLEEQNKIVKELSCVERLITIKNEEVNKLNLLVKSQFVEMFKNVNETVRLGDCCDVHARIGWQALTSKEHMKHGDYMLITGTDFKNNEIDYSTCVYVTKERYEMDEHIILKNDDILITKDGTIGKVAIVHNLPKPSTLNGGVFVVRPDERFNKEYITYVFKGPLFEKYVNKSKTGATIKHLNQKHLVEFCIPMPSLEEQLKFSEIYKQIDKQKFEFEKSLKKLQELQESLMQEYFG